MARPGARRTCVAGAEGDAASSWPALRARTHNRRGLGRVQRERGASSKGDVVSGRPTRGIASGHPTRRAMSIVWCVWRCVWRCSKRATDTASPNQDASVRGRRGELAASALSVRCWRGGRRDERVDDTEGGGEARTVPSGAAREGCGHAAWEYFGERRLSFTGLVACLSRVRSRTFDEITSSLWIVLVRWMWVGKLRRDLLEAPWPIPLPPSPHSHRLRARPLAMGAPRELELSDEVEGEEDGTTDFVFRLAGDPIPLLPTDSNPLPLFDLLSPPARPLVVSDRHATVFVAHPSGFIAVRTKELIEASKEAREKGKASTRCAQDCCVADVPLPGVSLIALSHDESVLAACTDTEIQFFSLASLLTHKDVVPSSSCSLGRAGTVKDFKWLNHASAAYIVLSNGGLLCHGSLGEGLKDVMENVDAVDCCKEGNHIAVARGNKLTILSPDFKETCSMSLLFQLWSDESDSEGTTIKVDSIGWFHGDSIVIGCVRLNEDDNEEGYLVQVIRTEESTFCESPGKPDVYTYVDFFHGIMDDVLPSGVGPNLLLGYLHRWDLMVASNKKSIEDHIALLKWPSAHDDEKTVTYLEMLEDKYSPRIDLQENGDDNVILGFGVENVSLFQKITVTVGPEQKEVAPQHILLCLTGEGKLAVYYLARISDPSDLPHATGTSLAISSSPVKEAQVPSSPSVFPFDINDYIVEGETSCSAPDAHQEEHVLSAATRDRLQLMLPYLERDIADLVCNARRLLDIFLAIKGELNQDLLAVLSPVAFIEGQAPKVIQAKQRLADREVQSTLAVREESTKQEMLRLKELIDGSKNAFCESQERINSLKIERKQLLMKLEENNSLIQLEEANSTQLPKIAEEQKKKMTAKYSKLMMIRSQKDKAIFGSADEDNRLIAEADAVRLDALNAVRAALNL